MKKRYCYCFLSSLALAGQVDGLSTLPQHQHQHQPLLENQAQQRHPLPAVINRRDALRNKAAYFAALCGWVMQPKARHWIQPPAAWADAETTQEKVNNPSSSQTKGSFFVQGKVLLPPDYQPPSSDQVDLSSQALYITCRPDRPDNVPKAILDGTRGKAPPILTARFEKPSFPFSFELTKQDLTEEGMSSDMTGVFWWEQDDLIVSARLDTDGIAATRSPEDLVGRTIYYHTKAGGDPVELNLSGRGAFGKFATKK